MQLYVSFPLFISPGLKNFYSAKGRIGSGIRSPHWLYTPANAGSFSLCAMTAMWHFQAVMFADIMSHFNAIFCTSFISSHLNKRLWRKTELCKPSAMLRTLPTFHRLGTTQCEAWGRVCCRSAVSLFAMLQIIKIIIFDCTCNHKMQCELKWSDSGMQPLPCIRSYADTIRFSLCRKKESLR